MTTPPASSSDPGPAEKALRKATPQDLPGICHLLLQAGLPTQGTEEAELFVLEQNGTLQGVVGLERYGSVALLRSLAVAPVLQGQGRGRLLMTFITDYARRQGFSALYGLTATIPDWLLRLGFTEVSRDVLPEALHASQELRGACPASARVFAQVLPERQ
jgi:amino-acid N-acetyltransferase